jgi:hypothetical protein
MNELGPEARDLIEAAGDAHDPDPGARDRVRAAVLRRVSAGAAIATTVAAKSTAAAATGGAASGLGAATTAFVSKAAVVLALAGAAAGAPYVARKVFAPTPKKTDVALVAGRTEGDRPQPASTEGPVAASVDSASPTTDVESMTPTADPVESPRPVAPPPGARIASASAAASVVVPQANADKTPDPPAAPASALSAELAALHDADLALRGGDAARALSIVDRLPADTTLGPERAGLRALALCTLGRADGRDAAARFLRDHGASPLAPRVRGTCTNLP